MSRSKVCINGHLVTTETAPRHRRFSMSVTDRYPHQIELTVQARSDQSNEQFAAEMDAFDYENRFHVIAHVKDGAIRSWSSHMQPFPKAALAA